MTELTTMTCPGCKAPIPGAGACPYCGAEVRELAPTQPPPAQRPWLDEARALMADGQKIQAIKLARMQTGLGLREAKLFVETGMDDPARIAALPQRSAAEVSSSGCFPASAQVDTPHGPQSIASLNAGDAVWSYSPENGRVVERVTRRLVHRRTQLWLVDLDAGPPLVVTRNHRVLCGRGWVRVDALRSGDELIRPGTHGNPRVQNVAPGTRCEPVYNLYTTGPHTFLVDGCVAHNFTVWPRLRTLCHRIAIDPIAQLAWTVVPGPA